MHIFKGIERLRFFYNDIFEKLICIFRGTAFPFREFTENLHCIHLKLTMK